MGAGVLDGALRACLADIFEPGGGARAAARIIALPNAHTPRALLPAAPRDISARIVRRHFGGGGTRRALKTTAASLMVRVGAASQLSRWQFKELPAPAARHFHAWVSASISEPYRIGLVLIGPERANRKPVVMLTDSQGELIGVVKVGYNRVTQPLVRAEAAALKQLAGVFAGVIHIPEFIAAGRLENSEMLLMKPLPALKGARQRIPRHTLLEVVRSVAEVAPGGEAKLEDSLSHPRVASLRAAGALVAARTTGVARGSSHGDLHAGNLAIAADGRPTLWDWERWSLGLPIGFDLLHYDLQSWITNGELSPALAARELVRTSPTILSPLGVAADIAPDVARDYLMRLAARYVTDAQDEAGSQLGAVEDWLFPAVLSDR